MEKVKCQALAKCHMRHLDNSSLKSSKEELSVRAGRSGKTS